MKKTNALRMLDARHIPYETVTYPVDEKDLSGANILDFIPLEADAVFKTLVLKGEKKGIVVCMVPALKEIDLKKLAQAIKDKKVEMLPMKLLLSTTGYVRGGCSPVGMKKQFPTYIDQTCLNHERLSVSAGIRGMQVLLKREDLIAVSQAQCVDVIKTM